MISSKSLNLLLLVYLFIFPNLSNGTSMLFSCQTAQYVDNSALFCSGVIEVTWLTASAYKADNFSVYSPGAPMSIVAQNQYANELYTQINAIKSNDATSNCKDFNKIYSCLSAFPMCPLTAPSVTSSGYSYLKTCRVQCRQVENTCKPKQSLNCNQLPEDGCALYIQPDMFLLSTSQGPYNSLSILYPLMITCWTILLLLWIYGTFFHFHKRCVLLCKFLTVVPFLKVVSLIFGCLFWLTCNQIDICSVWMSVAYVNLHLVYETGLLAGYILIAKGWRVTRHKLYPEEWRSLIFTLSGFYMANSLIAVLETAVLSNQPYWILIGILYGSLYLSIFLALRTELLKIHVHIQLLKETMPKRFQLPLLLKGYMYDCFLITIFLSISLEIICHTLIAYNKNYTIVLCVYEVLELCLVCWIGYLFRPQEFSPFFFMIPSQANDSGTRPLPVIHLEKDTSNATGFGILGSSGVETAAAGSMNDDEEDGLLSLSASLSLPSSPTRNQDTTGNSSSSSSNYTRNNIINNVNNNSNKSSSNPTSPNSSLKSKLIASVTMKNSSSSMLSQKLYQKSAQKKQLLQNQQSQQKYEIELAPLMDLGFEHNINNNNNINILEGMEEEEEISHNIRDPHVMPDWKLAFIQSSSSTTANNNDNNNDDGHRISIGLISASNSSRN